MPRARPKISGLRQAAPRTAPERRLVVVDDSTYACFRLIVRCQRFLPNPVTFVTCLRLDAALNRPRYAILVRWEVLTHRRMTQREEAVRRAA